MLLATLADSPEGSSAANANIYGTEKVVYKRNAMTTASQVCQKTSFAHALQTHTTRQQPAFTSNLLPA